MLNSCDNLFDFIKQFDIEMSKNPNNIELWNLFAKIIVNIGQTIQQSNAGLNQRQELTLMAANEFITNKNDEKWDSFCQSSTNSYPFGPGDGCYCIEETGVSGCNPGSGCISGIGSLALLGLPESLVWSIVKIAIADYNTIL
jgi:hypothetical protein